MCGVSTDRVIPLDAEPPAAEALDDSPDVVDRVRALGLREHTIDHHKAVLVEEGRSPCRADVPRLLKTYFVLFLYIVLICVAERSNCRGRL